jgi:hypothetical protein
VVVLLFYSALRFTHLELFLVRILVPYAPVVGVFVFFFFPPGTPAVFVREGYAGYVALCRVLIVVLITTFLFSARGLDFQLFDGGIRALLQSQLGALGLCALWAAGFLAPAE